LLGLSFWLAGLAWPCFVVFAATLWLLVRQIRVLNIDDPALCLRLFKANREFGLAVGVAIIAGRLL
jgi:4-hydroxybenzoate polyprenyltransferase